jgi:hypothetical protein
MTCTYIILKCIDPVLGNDRETNKMKEELMARVEAKIEAEVKTNNEKFEVIQSTLISHMDIHYARAVVIQVEIIAYF